MNSALRSNPAGEQVAAAVLAAALALPLAFAFGGMKNCRLLRDAAPASQRAESSPALDSARQPVLSVASPLPILARRDGHALRLANKYGAEAANMETPITQESVKGTDRAPGNGAKADAADRDEAAARLAKVIEDQIHTRGQSE